VSSPGHRRRWLRWIGGFFFLLILLAGVLAATIIWRPKTALLLTINRLAPGIRFKVDSVRWTSRHSIQLENVRMRHIKIQRVILDWSWRGLWHRRIGELRLEYPEVTYNLKGSFFGDQPAKKSGRPGFFSGLAAFWHLDVLRIERGTLSLLGLGPRIPPVDLPFEGTFDNIPLGTRLSQQDLDEEHHLTLNGVQFRSPLDPVRVLLNIQQIRLEFCFGRLATGEFDALTLEQPVLSLDPGLFWFIEELRRSEVTAKPASPESGLNWRVRRFAIQDGRLDIARLRGVTSQYPIEFELHRENLKLSALSLADFRVELSIPNQDISIPALNLTFENLHGKIAFHLGEPQPAAANVPSILQRPNDIVNTIYVDTIRWKNAEITAAWLAMVFDEKNISGSFGGNFAKDYLTGGITFGWFGNEPWRVWGGLANVDAAEVVHSLAQEYVTMNGRARLGFDVQGQDQDLKGRLQLQSLSPGVINIQSLTPWIEKIQTEAVGIKDDTKRIILSCLRDYPYENYQLDAEYTKPNGRLLFEAHSPVGVRKLDLNWHGR
jgi:hypothetical protein